MLLIILFIGWLLVFLEVFFIPGITLFAVVGTITMIGGVIAAYISFGPVTGTLTLIGTALFTFLSIIFGFKSGLFNTLTLKDTVSGKMNEIDETKVKTGQVGKALSRIAPSGTAVFDDQTFEVHSMGEFIDQDTSIEVLKIQFNKIFVKQKT
jgi:membrane-bound ClpP family serine protease